METEDERERRQEVASVLVKLVGVVVAIGLVIGVGAWLMVKALDLDEPEATGLGPGPVQPVTPLPTTALPVPTESGTETPDDPGLTRTSAPTWRPTPPIRRRPRGLRISRRSPRRAGTSPPTRAR